MDHWKSVGYQHFINSGIENDFYSPKIGKSGTKDFNQDFPRKFPVNMNCVSTGESHHRFIEPVKLGFYDSYIPCCYYGYVPAGYYSRIPSYNQSIIKGNRSSGWCPSGREETSDSIGRNGRVLEILDRLQYLSSKKGLGIQDLIQSIHEDVLFEKQKQLEDELDRRIALAVSSTTGMIPACKHILNQVASSKNLHEFEDDEDESLISQNEFNTRYNLVQKVLNHRPLTKLKTTSKILAKPYNFYEQHPQSRMHPHSPPPHHSRSDKFSRNLCILKNVPEIDEDEYELEEKSIVDSPICNTGNNITQIPKNSIQNNIINESYSNTEKVKKVLQNSIYDSDSISGSETEDTSCTEDEDDLSCHHGSLSY